MFALANIVTLEIIKNIQFSGVIKWRETGSYASKAGWK